MVETVIKGLEINEKDNLKTSAAKEMTVGMIDSAIVIGAIALGMYAVGKFEQKSLNREEQGE